MSDPAGQLSGERRHGYLRRRFCVTGVILVAGAISGCASTEATHVESPSNGNYSLAQHFLLQGRISVRVGDKIESGGIHWARRPEEERLEIFTPFGTQVAELVKPRDGPVTLRRDRETVAAESIGALTASVLGVALDMDAIAAWIQGDGAADGVPLERRLANGEVWQVSAERFQFRDAHRFASRLSAIRGDTVVRLVIDEWQAL